MNERGSTLLEVLIAASLASLILGAGVVMTVATSRFGIITTDQAAVQRVGTSVIDEMTKRIETAGCTSGLPTCIPLEITTCNGVPNSLRVTNADWTDPSNPKPQRFCFRRNVAGEPGASDLANTKIVRDWEQYDLTNNVWNFLGTFDLLSGTLMSAGTRGTVTTVDGPTLVGANCGPTAGFCPGVTGSPPAIVMNQSTTTTANYTQPDPTAAPPNNSVAVSVGSTTWMPIFRTVFVATGGYYTVTSIVNGTTVNLTNSGTTGNASAGTTIAAGSAVSLAPAATVTFRLRFQVPETSGYQATTFTTTMARRN